MDTKIAVDLLQVFGFFHSNQHVL